MSRFPTSLMMALCVALFLSSLSMVAWRQGRARVVMEEREAVLGAIAMELDERTRLLDQIRHLQSYSRIRRVAADQLGLRIPADSSIVFLFGDES